MVHDTQAGQDKPAAILLETIQAEGGVYVADAEFLRVLSAFCTREKNLMIVDDIQVGCGRVGACFSFEEAGIVPDMVTLSKSISGYGLPMALLLMRPEFDVWQPGQHNGTFRGNHLAFVSAAQAICAYWRDDDFAQAVRAKGSLLGRMLNERIAQPWGFELRGRDMGHRSQAGRWPCARLRRMLRTWFHRRNVRARGRSYQSPATVDDWHEELAARLDILVEALTDSLGVP